MPGYPKGTVFFFDIGTAGGLVANNTAYARCTTFVGYSASGVLLEDNHFSELPYGPHSLAAGNGFASFGSPRSSERVSYSRNVYQGQYNGDNSPDGSFPHEAFSSDGTGGAYAGYLVSASNTSVTVKAPVNSGYFGGAIAVLMGKGRGQVRRVVPGPLPPPPPPPPAMPPVPPFPLPSVGWKLMAGHNGSMCADAKNLWQGEVSPAACLTRCATLQACNFATVDFFLKPRPGPGYCALSASCAKMKGWCGRY